MAVVISVFIARQSRTHWIPEDNRRRDRQERRSLRMFFMGSPFVLLWEKSISQAD
jgi:hypothetical protein